jgi:dihydrofolate reductase
MILRKGISLHQHHGNLIRPTYMLTKRSFAAVKELPWCRPTRPATRTKPNNIVKQTNDNMITNPSPGHTTIDASTVASTVTSSTTATSICQTCTPLNSIDEKNKKFGFGIVAAMDQNRIIGANGSLPWDIPEDREHFETLTRGKILIIGRKTFLNERGQNDFSHVDHCKNIIIVSTTLPSDDSSTNTTNYTHSGIVDKIDSKIHFVQSFDAAIKLASTILEQDDDDDDADDDTAVDDGKTAMISRNENDNEEVQGVPIEINCWVGGGQRIYEEALRHPMAIELQLTHIKSIDENKKRELECYIKEGKVAFFPAKYRYDNAFNEIHDLSRNGKDTTNKDCFTYSFHVYRKKKRSNFINTNLGFKNLI